MLISRLLSDISKNVKQMYSGLWCYVMLKICQKINFTKLHYMHILKLFATLLIPTAVEGKCLHATLKTKTAVSVKYALDSKSSSFSGSIYIWQSCYTM